MKLEAKILLLLGAFFAVMGIVYIIWSGEVAGGVMIIAGGLLGFLPGSYYWWWSRRMAVRPEDNDTATRESGAGVVETFPGTSIFPFTLGAGAFFTVLALVYGVWLMLPGIGLVVWAMLGGVAEGRRGGSH
jgi:Cytochrome c oxidase subunit IV